MPGASFIINGQQCHVDYAGDYKPGDPPPSGFLDWYDWAEAQHKAGLKQTQCPKCGKWRYPQEMSDVLIEFPVGRTSKAIAAGEPAETTLKAVCIDCPGAPDCRLAELLDSPEHPKETTND